MYSGSWQLYLHGVRRLVYSDQVKILYSTIYWLHVILALYRLYRSGSYRLWPDTKWSWEITRITPHIFQSPSCTVNFILIILYVISQQSLFLYLCSMSLFFCSNKMWFLVSYLPTFSDNVTLFTVFFLKSSLTEQLLLYEVCSR